MTTHPITATAPRVATARDASSLLRRAFQVNAASSALSAVSFLAGGAALAERLGSPTSLVPIALLLLVFAAFVAWLSTRESIPTAGAWIVVALDVAWVAASATEIALGVYSTLGNWVFGAMAVFVAVLADVQVLGILRIRRARG